MASHSRSFDERQMEQIGESVTHTQRRGKLLSIKLSTRVDLPQLQRQCSEEIESSAARKVVSSVVLPESKFTDVLLKERVGTAH